MLDAIAEQIVADAYTAAPGAARDLALAKTHLEDALTRYNSAQYRAKGTWKRADPDVGEDTP